MKQVLMGLLCALLPVVGQAQRLLNNRYPVGTFLSGATAMQPVPGGYWVAGAVLSATTTDQGGFIQFVDTSGVAGRLTRWDRPGWQYYTGYANSLNRTADGGLSLVGSVTISQPTRGDLGLLVRFNAQGDTLWTRRYADTQGGPNVILRNGRELPNGDFILVGEEYYASTSPTDNVCDAVLIRTDARGQMRWRRTYDTLRYDAGAQVLPTADGGFLISSATQGPLVAGGANGQGWVFKTDSLGQLQWQRTFGSSLHDWAGPAVATSDGGYVVAGAWTAYVQSGSNYLRSGLVWLDAAGHITRQRLYGVPMESTGPVSLWPASSGGYVLAGQMVDQPNLVSGYLLGVCEDGDSLWSQPVRFSAAPFTSNYLRDVRPTADGGWAGAGFGAGVNTGPQAVWLFKTDRYGYLQPGGAPPTVQCRPTGLPGELIMNNEQWAVWPNPSADGRFTLTPPPAPSPIGRGSLTLTVTDALGRAVWRGAWDGTAETVVDLAASAPGLYVLRVQDAGGRQRTYKLLRQ